MKRIHHILLIATASSLLWGCSTVTVLKLDPRSGKPAEGAAEGLRYYMPRPYVSVHEPFIVASEVYLAAGEMSPDSRHVLLTEVPQGLNDLVNQKLIRGDQRMGALRIDASQISAAPLAPEGRPHSATIDQKDDAPPSAAPAASAASSPVLRPGMGHFKAVNDNSAYAVTPLPRYFNIVWLPDFDEQYAVKVSQGLGSSGVLLGLGQGWSLQSLDATVDNSALAKPLLDFYAGTIGALQKVATAKIEAPLALLSGGSPHSAAVKPGKSAQTYAGGTPVTLKVTKVRIAAPGLYPILKPAELASAAAQVGDVDSKRILLPKPPFTNIAFNTYDAIVIEAASPRGDSALRIQQYVDSSLSLKMDGLAGTDTDTASSGSDPSQRLMADAQKALNIELSSPALKTRGKAFFAATLSATAGAVKVLLKKTSGGTAGELDALPDDDELKILVKNTLGARGVNVTEITIQR